MHKHTVSPLSVGLSNRDHYTVQRGLDNRALARRSVWSEGCDRLALTVRITGTYVACRSGWGLSRRPCRFGVRLPGGFGEAGEGGFGSVGEGWCAPVFRDQD